MSGIRHTVSVSVGLLYPGGVWGEGGVRSKVLTETAEPENSKYMAGKVAEYVRETVRVYESGEYERTKSA